MVRPRGRADLHVSVIVSIRRVALLATASLGSAACLLTTSLDGLSEPAAADASTIDAQSSDTGRPGAGGDGSPRDDAATPMADSGAPVILCETEVCSASTQVCCESKSASNHCVSLAASCTGNTAECDDARDCSGPDAVCCRTSTGSNRCTAAASCTGYQVCEPSAAGTCPAGTTCVPDPTNGFNGRSYRCK
jgi:hypothetical protein